MVMQAEPIKIGWLIDFARPGGPSVERQRSFEMRFAEAVENGELDRPVQLVIREAQGLPMGSAESVVRTYYELAEEQVLGILGPGIADNCLVAQPLAEEFGIPTLNWPGTEHSRGVYGFHFQLGSLPDEGPMIVDELVKRGHETVAVIRDQSPIGAEYFDYFDQACVRTGFRIVSDQRVSPIATDLTTAVQRSQASGASSLVYLGFGQIIPHLGRALAEADWAPPRFMNTAFLHGYATAEALQALEGWVGVDMVDRDNTVTQAFWERYEKRYGERPVGPGPLCLYDVATMAVEGLRWAPILTADGFRQGLERAHQIPSVCGGAGTVMGFAPWDHAAYKGPDWLLFQEVKNGKQQPYQKA